MAASPLLVLLHGDGETPRSMLDAWEAAAAARGIVVLAPACPASEGCSSRSWGKWDGPPSWLMHQIDALAETRPIDRERMWLAGWSGGGTYIGWNTQELERSFAALVIHGGGVRPRLAECSDPKAGIYFLGGDRNPLHHLAEELHDYYVRCDHADMTWTVLKGVDHQGERAALASRRAAILDWLETRRRSASAALGPDAARSEAAPVPAPAPTMPAAPRPPPSSPSCRCVAAGVGPSDGRGGHAEGASLLAVVVALERRRQRSRGFTPRAATP